MRNDEPTAPGLSFQACCQQALFNEINVLITTSTSSTSTMLFTFAVHTEVCLLVYSVVNERISQLP